jgi:hypothetical protein
MGAPELLRAEMPLVRMIKAELLRYGYQEGTAEYREAFDSSISFYRKFGWRAA